VLLLDSETESFALPPSKPESNPTVATMKSRLSNPFHAIALFTASFAPFPTIAHAADQTWISLTGPTADWNTTDLNWDAGVAWSQNNNAIFGGTGETVTLTEAISAGGLTFNVAGYTITGNTLTLAPASIINPTLMSPPPSTATSPGPVGWSNPAPVPSPSAAQEPISPAASR
jgi:hypothetical protein